MMRACRHIQTGLVKAGWLIDGTGRPAQRGGWMQITRGVIERMGGRGDEIPSQPPDMTVCNLSEYTILPGLIDSHVHLVMSGNPNESVRKHQPAPAYEDAEKTICRHIADNMRHGVMAVRDGGDGQGHVTQYQSLSLAAHDACFVLRAANRGWYKPGRYGKIVGGQPLSGVNDPDAIGRGMNGADQVKIVNSGLNSLQIFGKQTSPQFTRDELSAIVALAKKAGKPVMVHANGAAPVADAVMAGVSSIEHGYFMGRDNLNRMADAGVFWVPTVATMFAYSRLGGDGAAVAERNMEDQLEQLAYARSAGVKIALGTDAGSPGVDHGAGVGMEMALFLRAGYAIAEVVQTATARGAALLGLPERGRLVPGMRALFVVIKGPPENIPCQLGESIVCCGHGSRS